MQHVKRMTYLCLLLILCVSCSQNEDNLGQGDEAVTRSYPVIITYCYDAYVDIMGVSVYKGTTCKSYSPNMGGGGPGWYIAGGFPEYGTQTDYGSGGGGNGFYIGDNWQFGFPNLTKIYRYDSSLNVFQKSKLEHVIEMFYEDTTIPDYKKLYKKLLDNDVRIKFLADSTSVSPAYYNTADVSITFRYDTDVNWNSLLEELVHAVQHNCYYHSTMNAAYKNYEFEAKVFIDVVNAIALYYDGYFTTISYIPTQTDSSSIFENQYVNWLTNVGNRGYISSSDFAEYEVLCSQWQGYNGTYNSSIQPNLLRAFFGRIRPPQPPSSNY